MEIASDNRPHAMNDTPGMDQPNQCAMWHNAAKAHEGGLRQLDVDLLRPGRYQPRRTFAPEALVSLAESIRVEDVVQPIIVRPLPGAAPQRYEIIAGERCWRAVQLAGLQQVPALGRHADDHSTLLQVLVENIQREDINPVETACGVDTVDR